MSRLRKLNHEGEERFKKYIIKGAIGDIPLGLLENENTSESINDDIELRQKKFESRYEIGVYLTEKFREIDMQKYLGDSGFWSAIALFWIDQLVPERANGRRNPSKWYNYVFAKEDYKWGPRHSIFSTWKLVHQHGKNARFMLNREVHIRGEITEQIMARIEYCNIESVMESASKLYFDEQTQSFKKGAGGRGPGAPHKLIKWLQQIEVTYDLHTMNSEHLYRLLPAEFNRFKEN